MSNLRVGSCDGMFSMLNVTDIDMRYIHSFLRLVLVASALASGQMALAADIRVHVVDRNLGKSLNNAAVCLGTSANPTQFGSQLTAENGYAVFSDIPETPLVLTVSKADYSGYQQSHSAKSFDITLRVGLPSGGLGPQCDPGEVRRTVTQSEAALTISAFRLNKGKSTTRNRSVELNAEVSGTPTHYRVAEHWSFSDAEWLDYAVRPKYRLSEGVGQKQVYFQVRRLRGDSGAQLESLSGIAQSTVYLTN